MNTGDGVYAPMIEWDRVKQGENEDCLLSEDAYS